MATYRLAAIIQRSSVDAGGDFIVVRQTPPPKLAEKEYLDYVDSDLWDLPSAPLNPLGDGLSSATAIEGSESWTDKVDLRKFDVDSAINQVMSQVLGGLVDRDWSLWKYVEEPEFGPFPLMHTVFVVGLWKSEEENLQEASKWMSTQSSLKLILEVKPGGERIGPLVVIGLLTDSAQSKKWTVPHSLRCQEYPLGVTVVPMGSRTKEPFYTTNLVVIAPDKVTSSCENSSFAICGDALIMDPGCRSECHEELMEIVSGLPKKLVVFVTHHHYDHVDGLSVIQKYSPDATLVAHENTMRRIGKDDWSLGYTPISGDEQICVGGQTLKIISAPGHTDGHMALLHVDTNSLIVGDHCVGQGSAILDITSGGNMKNYFQTTYNFMELSPHALIPMHGRINLWPKRMLCGYLKHRRDRESSILKAIESGAETLYDIITKSYADTNAKLWIAASSNIRLHVEYLAHQNKLPKGFSLEKFQCSYEDLVSKMANEVLKNGKPSL